MTDTYKQMVRKVLEGLPGSSADPSAGVLCFKECDQDECVTFSMMIRATSHTATTPLVFGVYKFVTFSGCRKAGMHSLALPARNYHE